MLQSLVWYVDYYIRSQQVLPPGVSCSSHHKLLLVVFSAWGEIRTGKTCQLCKPPFPCWLRASCSWMFALLVAPPLEYCLTGLVGSSTQAGTDCYNSLVADIGPTARHWPDHSQIINARLLICFAFIRIWKSTWKGIPVGRCLWCSKFWCYCFWQLNPDCKIFQ